MEADIGEASDGRSKNIDISGWISGDRNRLWLNVEKKNYGEFFEKFESQALYSHNFAKNWDVQAGAIYDLDTAFTQKMSLM